MTLPEAWQALDRDDFRAAERAAREALANDANHADAWYLLGSTFLFEGRAREALEPLLEAARRGARRGLDYRLGHCHLALGDLASAEAALRREASAHPDYANAHNTLGVVLLRLGRREEAIAALEAAVRADALHAEARHNLASLLYDLGRNAEAIDHARQAAALMHDAADAHFNLGRLLLAENRHGEATSSFARALQKQPDRPYALGGLVSARIGVCDWREAAPHIAALRAGVRAGRTVTAPFVLLGVSPSIEEHALAAAGHVREALEGRPAAAWRPAARPRADKIRLAYLSADFHEHATAKLAVHLFELHDRSRFELIGVSYGRDDGSPMRKRLTGAFDRFIDVAADSDEQAAARLREMKVDIAVDLKGHTPNSRLLMLAERPAPLQATYLGYPGPIGASFIDYVLADAVVVPAGDDRYYAEKVVRLPGSYQVNDLTRPIAERAPTRKEVGLPEEAFVLCCFNNNYKITPEVYALWMQLLKDLPASVLWLLQDNAAAVRNLREAAASHGVDPARVVFAARLPHSEHLARHRLADLFIDTLPCNAHTTASDALWAGLPVLTCLGTTFAGRVAASLLHAVGLPELVTTSPGDYAALALKLGRERAMLNALREKLARNRSSQPLFDTQRFRRGIEAAYTRMWEIHQRGEPPRSFEVG